MDYNPPNYPELPPGEKYWTGIIKIGKQQKMFRVFKKS